MKTLKFSDISASDIKNIAQVHEQGISAYEWTQVERISLNHTEKLQIDNIISRLFNYKTSLMNEATIWARAIYPLLVLAEQDDIQAWAQITLQARYPHVELQLHL